MNCCDECHFAAEELLALPSLSASEQRRLLAEHRQLEALPQGPERHALIVRHARWEERLFAARLHPSLARRFTREHIALLGSRCLRPWRRGY